MRELRTSLAALGLWALALPAVPLLLPGDAPLMVLAPHHAWPSLLAGQTALVGQSWPFWWLRGDAAQLYSAGAWLVLPAPRTGCLGWRPVPPRPNG